ncbi:MAG: hypothetical protein ACTHXO_01280, partial [Actinomycetaceae bacterium]
QRRDAPHHHEPGRAPYPPPYSDELDEGVVYTMAGVMLLQPDGGELVVATGLAEGRAYVDDQGNAQGGIPADWAHEILALTLEDGGTPDGMGIERRYDGWAGEGDITFRVTDADSVPPAAVLLDFEPRSESPTSHQ